MTFIFRAELLVDAMNAWYPTQGQEPDSGFPANQVTFQGCIPQGTDHIPPTLQIKNCNTFPSAGMAD